MTDPYRDLRRTEGSSSPAGRPSFGEAKPLQLRRIGPDGSLSVPGDSPAATAGAFGLATVPRSARTAGRLQGLIAGLLSFLLLGSLAALALIGSGGLPGSPVVPPRAPLVREVQGSPVEALPGTASGGGAAAGQPGQPEQPETGVVAEAVDEGTPPLPVGGQIGGDQDQGGGGEQGGGGQGGGGQGGGGQGGGGQGGGGQGGGGQGGGGQGGGGGQDGGGGPPPGGDAPPADGGSSVGKETGSGGEAKATGHEKQKGQGHQGMNGDGPGKGKGKGHAKHGGGSESTDKAKDTGKPPGFTPPGKANGNAHGHGG